MSEITDNYNFIIEHLRRFNQNLKIIFTLSPVRYVKDGCHINQLSKSTLLLAIDNIINSSRDCFYFPSYEILLDDLRDYRFYNDDLVHPNDFAVNYIFDKFSECFFKNETKVINKSVNDLNNMLNHRPFNTNSNDYRLFLKKTNEKILSLCEKYPFLDLRDENQIIKNKIKLLDKMS